MDFNTINYNELKEEMAKREVIIGFGKVESVINIALSNDKSLWKLQIKYKNITQTMYLTFSEASSIKTIEELAGKILDIY